MNVLFYNMVIFPCLKTGFSVDLAFTVVRDGVLNSG